jgi:hypothetical protein
VRLGLAYVVRYLVPSFLAAVPLILAFALAQAVERAELISFATRRIPGGLLPRIMTEYLIDAVEAGFAVLIVVMTIRRVMRGAGEGTPLGAEIAGSIRLPLVKTAFRSGWIVALLLGAIYLVLHVSGGLLAEGGPANLLYLPIYILIMPLTLGGPLGLVIGPIVFAAVVIGLGLIGLFAVENTLENSGAEAAGELPVLGVALQRKFGMFRLVLNLMWLYGLPFMLLYVWVPMRIFGAAPMPSFEDVATGTTQTASASDLFPAFARGLYDGAAVGAGLILVALAALVIWNQAAAIAIAENDAPAKPEVATRNRPWHDPKTALETVTEKRAAFGKRSR